MAAQRKHLSRAAVVEVARTYLGTPFHIQGRLRGVGGDCVAVVTWLLEDFGVEHADVTTYDRFGQGAADLDSELGKWMLRVPPLRLWEPGNFVSFWVREKDGPSAHVALVTALGGGLGLLHSHQSAGKVVEHRLDDRWRGRANCGYCFPGLEGW